MQSVRLNRLKFGACLLPTEMANSKNKLGNVIQKVTSETIRLSDDHLDNHVFIIHPSRSVICGRKKNPCSFQITDVSSARLDGEESADDFDESHTDDNSRITDNETPSYSEDSVEIDEHYVPHKILHSSSAPSVNAKEKTRRASFFGTGGRWTCLDYLEGKNLFLSLEDNSKIDSEEKCYENILEEKFQDIMQLNSSTQLIDKEVNNAYLKVASLLASSNSDENMGSKQNETAAIDLKIEQAMDLVKSHLMFAVRQDVETLKLKISELMSKINQLETENSRLRAKCSPEILRSLEQKLNPDIRTN